MLWNSGRMRESMAKSKKRRKPIHNNAHNAPVKRHVPEDIALARREVSVAAYSHSGPIPDPMTLEGYNRIVPGAADRIIRMAEEQSAHRQRIEAIAIKSRARDSLIGIISGLIIALVTIAAGTFIIYIGKVWSGTIIGSAGLVGLVSVFIYGTRSNRKERESKNKEN